MNSGRQTLFKQFKQQIIDDLIEFKKKVAETDNVSNDSIRIINKPSSRYSPNRHDGLNWDSTDERQNLLIGTVF